MTLNGLMAIIFAEFVANYVKVVD